MTTRSNSVTALRQGAQQAVVNCMKIISEDRVVIVGDNLSRTVVEALSAECTTITKSVKHFSLDDFGSRPLQKLPEAIVESLGWSTAVFYTAGSQKGELPTIRKPLIKLATEHGREAHMVDVTEEIMKTGMRADYAKIKELTRKVYGIVKGAEKIVVTTKLGTNVTVKLNPQWRWVICDGDISNMPERWSNLPDGEVFTCPLEVDGVIMVDGSIGDYFEHYNRLKPQIKLRISDSRVVALEVDNAELQTELREYMKQDKNANRIGEFAIGTNIGLTEFVGLMLQDEKFPGVHVAVGNSYPSMTGADFPSNAHCDFVIKDTTIVVDGKTIMKDGKFLV